MKQKWFKIKLTLGILISLLLIVSLISDIFSINENPKEYEKVYDFSVEAAEWRFRSIGNYINYNIGICCLSFFYLVLNSLCFFYKGNFLKYLVLIIDFILLVLIIKGSFASMSTGFDH
jgi:hypothetical protein